jgi:hypothetical protein
MISRARSHLSSYLFCADDLSTTSHRFDANTAAAVHPPSLANARRRMIAQQELTPAGCFFSSICRLIRIAVAAR